MNEEQAFLDAIFTNPEDDLPRLAYADWLAEQDNPRGEFIQIQCALAKETFEKEERKSIVAQEAQLLEQFGALWRSDLYGVPVQGMTFHRGFIEEVVMDMHALMSHVEKLLELAPMVRRVRVRNLLAGLEDFANHSCISYITELDLQDNFLGNQHLETLCASPYLTSIKWLNLGTNNFDSKAMPSLTNCFFFEQLTTLILRYNQIDYQGVATLSQSPLLDQITHLDLSYNQLGNESLSLFASSPYLPQLESLNLSGNPIGFEGCDALLSSKNLKSIRRLQLKQTNLGPEGLQVLQHRYGDWFEVE